MNKQQKAITEIIRTSFERVGSPILKPTRNEMRVIDRLADYFVQVTPDPFSRQDFDRAGFVATATAQGR